MAKYETQIKKEMAVLSSQLDFLNAQLTENADDLNLYTKLLASYLATEKQFLKLSVILENRKMMSVKPADPLEAFNHELDNDVQ